MALQVEERSNIHRIDWNLALAVLALTLIGLINVFSATHGPSAKTLATLFFTQIIWFLSGWIVYFLMTFLNYRMFMKLAYPAYVLNVLCLVFVLFHGRATLGAQRWIDFAGVKFQPSETMKLVLVLVCARYFYSHVRPQGHTLKELLIPTALTMIPALLVIKQPDLGTGLLLILVILSLFLFVKVRTNLIIGSLVLTVFCIPIAWKYALKDYQKNRVLTFLDPNRDPRGAGYNSIQSKIAVGSGQFLGKGFRKGTQSQLEFLPERHTDFIFSVLSEEHGFVGSVTTVGLFGLLFFMCVRIASQATDKFGVLITIGVMSILFWHMFINIGMTTGILPIVGVPLPLISYGGSSFLTTMMGLGIVSSVSKRRFLF